MTRIRGNPKLEIAVRLREGQSPTRPTQVDRRSTATSGGSPSPITKLATASGLYCTHSSINYAQIYLYECLLPFSSQSVWLPDSHQKKVPAHSQLQYCFVFYFLLRFSLMLREGRELTICDDRALDGRICIVGSFVICAVRQVLLGC